MSFDPEVWADVQRIALTERVAVSSVVNRAPRRELRVSRGLAAVAEWEGQHGAFTKLELAEVDGVLDQAGVGGGDRAAAPDPR